MLKKGNIKILFICFAVTLGALVSAQDLKIYPLTKSERLQVFGAFGFNTNEYLLLEDVISIDNDTVYFRLKHLDKNLELITEYEFPNLDIHTFTQRNDTVFLIGATNARHPEGSNRWGVWALNTNFEVSEYQRWNFTSASDTNFVFQAPIRKNNNFYVLLSDNEKVTCDVLVLGENFELLQDFRPEGNLGFGTCLVAGDSTFAISAFSVYVYDSNWKLIKKVDRPGEVEPLPNGRLGFDPDPIKYVTYADGHYITISDCYSDSLSMASGRPELFTDLQLYSLFIEEDGTASEPLVFGEHAWDESVNYYWPSLLDIGQGDVLVMGRTHPYEETGSKSQILAMRAKNNLTYPSSDNRFGEENRLHIVLGGQFINSSQEALVYGVYSSCVGCPRQGAFLLRLRGEALATNVMHFEKPKTVSVFPNPVKPSNAINLQWAGMEKQKWQVSFLDFEGKLVHATVVERGSETAEINLPAIPLGVYSLRAIAEDEIVYTGSVVVK